MSALTKNPSQSGLRRFSLNNPWERFWRNDWMNLWDGDSETTPSVNITEEKDSYRIDVAAPGLKKEDFHIDVEGKVMTISSEKKTEKSEDRDSNNYRYREYNYSSFSRSFTLPENAAPDKIAASYREGILNIIVPKLPGSQGNQSHRINIQ